MSNNDRKPWPSSNCLTSKQILNHSCKIKEHYEDLKDNFRAIEESHPVFQKPSNSTFLTFYLISNKSEN